MKTNLRRYLMQRNKLSFRNIRSGRESWHWILSRAQIFLLFFSLCAVAFGASLYVVGYTSWMDMAPGNPGAKSRTALIENIARLDSLEGELNRWQSYYSRMVVVLDGGVLQTTIDSLERRSEQGELIGRSVLDSLLREQYLSDSTGLDREVARRDSEVTFKMIPPSFGLITNHFDPSSGQFGIRISPPPAGSIVSVMDGTVIDVSWDPKTGHSITIQHANNMISVYKSVAQVVKSTGERVKSGEAIAISGEIIDGEIPRLEFQLWINGVSVNAENYIAM
ncbi:MAG: M23 family metallopeptidase [Rikenellaceae bacterium]